MTASWDDDGNPIWVCTAGCYYTGSRDEDEDEDEVIFRADRPVGDRPELHDPLSEEYSGDCSEYARELRLALCS